MFEITISGIEDLENFANALENFPQLLNEELVQGMKEAEDTAYLELSDYPPEPTYPIHWDSAKQRRAFFATNGFGGGIPHERTGDFGRQWEEAPIEVSPEMISGKVYQLEEWMHHVTGDNQGRAQSRIHQTRWDTIPQTGEKVKPRVIEILNAAVRRAAERFRVR